jgi:uncharacterized protein YcfL
MKTILSSTLAVVALAAFLSGCASSETGALKPQNTTKFNTEAGEKFVLLDAGAQQSVSCPGLQETTLPDGRLQVVAKVRNRESRRIQVQINCEFKDSQGFPIDSTPFQTLILTENATEGVPFTSINNKAKDYTIRVRQAR